MASAWTASMLMPTLQTNNLATRSLPSAPANSPTASIAGGSNQNTLLSLLSQIFGGGAQQQQSTQAENLAAAGYAAAQQARVGTMAEPIDILNQIVGGSNPQTGRGYRSLLDTINLEDPQYLNPSSQSVFGGDPWRGHAAADIAKYNLYTQLLLNNAPGAVGPSAISSAATAAAGSPAYSPLGQRNAGPNPRGSMPTVANTWGGNQAMSGWGLPPVLG